MPVLRRLIILVAVITAIPVVMWTITAVVRTYVGPPKLPTFRPIAAAPAPAAAGPDQAAAAPSADDNGKGARQPVVDANATTSNGASGGITGGTPDNAGAANAKAAPAAAAPGSLQTASLPGNASGNAAPAPDSGVAQFAPEDRQTSNNWPPPPAANWPSPGVQQPVAGPAAERQPIQGPVPLPRKRPHTVAIAQSQGIPLPRPRPDTAGPAAVEQQQPTPVEWLRSIFGSQGQQPAAAPGPAENEYQPEPH
jgi:hypothetical protein